MAGADCIGFGISQTTGKLVGVDEVRRGKACHCICAECGGGLIARQGEIRAWGFAHESGSPDCIGSAESALHRMAKQLVAQWRAIAIPELVATEKLEGLFYTLEETGRIPPRAVEISEGLAEVDCGSFRPDVMLTGTTGESIAVEIFVSHAVDAEKGARVRDAGQAMLEFDLAKVPRVGMTVAELDERLRAIAAKAKWIHHPEEGALRAKLHQKLLKKRADEEAARNQRLACIVDRRRGRYAGIASQPKWGAYEPTSKPVVLLAELRIDDVELLVKTHPLLDGVTIWAAHPYKACRERALCEIAKRVRAEGISCSDHTQHLGYVIAWGEASHEWVKQLQ